MATTMVDSDGSVRGVLAGPELREKLTRFVARKLPTSDAEDVVQATLADALAAQDPPSHPEAIRRWVFGIARHKIADHYRDRGRSAGGLDEDAAVADPEPLSARDLLRWAERELPDQHAAEQTLEWMLREGAGERLEEIANQVQQPAPRIRQRVARLRRYFRERWVAQAAAVAGVLLLVLAAAYLMQSGPEPAPPIAEEPTRDRPRQLRERAFRYCEQAEWRRCLDLLDQAKALDPEGEQLPAVQRSRREASRALAPPAPEPPSPVPPAPTPSETQSETPEQAPKPLAPREAPTARRAAPKVPPRVEPREKPKVDSLGAK